MNAAILAALTGTIGLAVGRLWDTRSEVARWRRDQRIRVYEHLTSGYYQVREAIRMLAMCEPDTGASENAEIRVYEVAANVWNQQVIAVWLHGSTSVAAAVENLDRQVVSLFSSARSKQFTWAEFQERRGPTLEALEQYVESVRKELNQQSLKRTVSYLRAGLPMSSEAADGVEASNGSND
jgi:hypothetical protein